MKSVKEIQRIQSEGNGIRVLTRGEVGAAFKAARDKKMEFTNFWTRRRGKASK